MSRYSIFILALCVFVVTSSDTLRTKYKPTGNPPSPPSRGPCASLAISPHGHWNNGGPANTNIGVPNYWHCDKNYISVPPNAVLTCQSNSQWDNVVPRCDPDETIKRCPSLPKCSHGSYVKQKEDLDECDEGQSHRLKCDDNYECDGDDTINCRDGQWDKSPRRCVPKKCPSLPKCDHGSYVKQKNDRGDNDEGQSHRIKCDDNFDCDGDEIITCNNAKWDNSPRTCYRRGPCASLAISPHGHWNNGGPANTNIGVPNYWHCDKNYVSVPPNAVLTCQSNSQWDNVVPRCDPAY